MSRSQILSPNIYSEVQSNSVVETGRYVFPKWLLYLFVLTVFTKEIGHVDLFGIDFDIIGYTFCFLYFLLHVHRLMINRTMIFFLFLILLFSAISKIYLGLAFMPFWKQFVPILIIFLAYFDFFARYNNAPSLFHIYIELAFYSAVFGIIQISAKFFFGIMILTEYGRIFVDSVAYEPSHYSALILPACVYSIMKFKSDKFRSIVILLAAILTFTATTYSVLMVTIVLIFFNPVYLLFVLPIIYYVFNYVFLEVEQFGLRFQGFENYIKKGRLESIESATSMSFLTNLEVAWYTNTKNPVFGSGLGGNEEMYTRHFANSSFRYHYLYGINAPSGHNLLIRILSETGFLGLITYVFLIIKGLILNGPFENRMISIACFSHFLCKALKLGGYFDYGTPFFIMLMWFNYVDYKNKGKATL